MLSCISTTWDQVQHLDVPTSERMSRCDRILGAACLKRRALKKLEPEELYVALDDFAPAHPRDKLNAVALLFATQLWFDIMEYPDGLEETFATSPLSAF
ncbi:uncharacterized protein FRV6_02967 [Fusarium oxysporum]|uniref:Uncharacterized protein n=1 Tax=Fusarium oxysporum TaxID=5507 RepID=A0A2H3T259_FUSOX|nr:uncharacterized protein FRV6_02967 [Fusarium oxysporum]